jgi:hypothetical protein
MLGCRPTSDADAVFSFQISAILHEVLMLSGN